MERRGGVPRSIAVANCHGDGIRDLASILLDACRLAPPSTLERGEPAWERLVEIAHYHAVTPLVARRLLEAPEGVPPRVLATLRAYHDANAMRNVMLTQQLVALLERLDAHGVEAMPIKGPALALSAYGDLALREFGDLDIVVRPASFDRARELLGKMGYTARVGLTEAGERALRSSDHHVALEHEESKTKVELHWSLDNGRAGRILDGDWVWSNARTAPMLGRELPALTHAASLVYLCVHGAKHGFVKLGWIRDIAGLLATSPPGALASTVQLASKADARRRLALGVRLARGLLGAPAREDLQLSEESDVGALEREVLAGLFSNAEPTEFRSLLFQSGTLDRVRDRAGYWIHIVSAPHVADVEAVRLPASLRAFYFALRPARLAAKRAKGWLLHSG